MYIQDIICRQGVGGAFPIRGGISKNTQKFGENSESGGRMKKQTLFNDDCVRTFLFSNIWMIFQFLDHFPIYLAPVNKILAQGPSFCPIHASWGKVLTTG